MWSRKALPAVKVLLVDSPTVRSFVEADPATVFAGRETETPLILDEVQSGPDALAWAKAEIDAGRTRTGQVVFTASHVLPLMRGVADRLASRIALFTLCPLSWRELYNTSGPVLPHPSHTLHGAPVSWVLCNCALVRCA